MSGEDQHPRRCTASKADGEPCGRWAIAGGWVCPAHGGSAPRVKTAAKRRLAEQRARKRLDEVEVEPIDDPLETFRELIAEARAWQKELASNLAMLDHYRYTADRGLSSEQIRGEAILFERAMDRLGKLLTDYIKLGIDERRVQLGVEQGRMVAEMFRMLEESVAATLASLGVAAGVIDELRSQHFPKLTRGAIEAVARGESTPPPLPPVRPAPKPVEPLPPRPSPPPAPPPDEPLPPAAEHPTPPSSRPGEVRIVTNQPTRPRPQRKPQWRSR